MWLEALAARLAYFTHRVSGHSVTWNRPPVDGACAGDVVCHDCGQVLWCRAHDPWRARRVEAPPDHWGGTRTNHSYRTLFENLQHVLRLAEECPSGPAGDSIRRAACELIEAEAWQRSVCQRRMLKSVTHLQSRHVRGLSGIDDPPVQILEQLADVLGRPQHG